ncbi:NAD(P)/FAD-dependent oxidoreductase [Rhizobium sp. PL01]|uniref:FAD-dependent oxidoreductase n=1 Tax=Rhizobium sp. PL01 TaxID=3085631 RepID=UPI0029824989|nr:NAD(P)/FAD-dependent oxidoreductase [Rhizobium sp. PL01]MDW5318184.1 NAD(P)/FAD-dependent oxidoreductase [Rhizobium sp. PL01]
MRAIPVQEKTVSERLEPYLANVRLRILIVGAGIAGTTLAALLRQRGERPVVIERGTANAQAGYMLGLMPLGGRVLNGLGLAEDYLNLSCQISHYELFANHGRTKRNYSLDPLMDEFGLLRGIERGELLSLLRRAAGKDAISFETYITHLQNDPDEIIVTFHDGSRQTFDLVVGADGMHSDVRRRILNENEYAYWRTGWAGWVEWAALGDGHRDSYSELWLAGRGVGVYPVKQRMGIFLAGRLPDLERTTAQAFSNQIATRLPSGPIREALGRVDRSMPSFLWKMEDCRAQTWSRGRVVLLGDAAAAFLPTAGVGASMAMDSAAALADELSRADATHMTYALRLYERRQRRRVELAQTNSRWLAKVMFVDNPVLAWLRDRVIRFYTIKMMIKDISRVMEGK